MLNVFWTEIRCACSGWLVAKRTSTVYKMLWSNHLSFSENKNYTCSVSVSISPEFESLGINGNIQSFERKLILFNDFQKSFSFMIFLVRSILLKFYWTLKNSEFSLFYSFIKMIWMKILKTTLEQIFRSFDKSLQIFNFNFVPCKRFELYSTNTKANSYIKPKTKQKPKDINIRK